MEYPLQSPEIQAKIDQVFMDLIGASRPMLAPEYFKQRILEVC